MKILISWIAFNSDFNHGKVDLNNSPNYIIHRDFYNYDKHLLLSSGEREDTRLNLLLNRLRLDFPKHNVEGVVMNVSDVIDLYEVKPKVEKLLLEYSDDNIDIFFSPGTSIMQVSWYICHSTLNLKTRLIQTRPANKSKSKKPELTEINVSKSQVPITAILKTKNLDKRKTKVKGFNNYKLTASIELIYDRAYKIAQADKVTSMIFGESGTGKEHLAKFIHENSMRCSKKMICINCSAFSDSLLEARLFGHKKGAFTGAIENHVGLFEQANEGTIFLDEIGDISPYMQQSLLRVLQEGEIMPIGGNAKKVDVRVIAATNQNLEELCKNKTFRWDLYYRLVVAELELPPLRERGRHDVEELLEFFNELKRKELKKKQKLIFKNDAKKALINYEYPGNVRELENLIETLYVFCDAEVSLADIPRRLKTAPQTTEENNSLKWRDIEKQHIEKVLNIYNGNQRQAWMALGYGSLNTFKKKIREYEINPEKSWN